MRLFSRPYLLIVPLALFLLAACASQLPQQATQSPPTVTATTHPRVMPPTYTPTSSPTPVPPTATPLPSLTPTPEPTIAATQMTPFVTGASLGAYDWSPNSRWLPYVDFNAQALHFYDAQKSTTCDFPVPVHDPNPDHFLAWLPDGRVVVQAADSVLAGLPCGKFLPATTVQTLVLDHQDPSYSPDGRYQVVVQPVEDSTQSVNIGLDLIDVASGKSLLKTAFSDLPRGGSSLPGYWLDSTHFLIPATADQGPLLLSPGKPPVKIAADIFQQPLKPGSGVSDSWLARSTVSAKPPRFHLMLVGVAGQAPDTPLQIYHSETGQVETLPYFALQGAFTNDGHWLLVGQSDSQASMKALIRPLDPPGAPFETFTDQNTLSYTWSPDGSRAIGKSTLPGNQSFISLYSSPKRAFLGTWQAVGYQLFPYWSPDGKYLAVSARSYTDPNQAAIFVIHIASR